MPHSTEEWKKISDEFQKVTGFPHCIGALDGKHIEQRGSGSGSFFYNYMGYNSQILMALVDARYRFLYYNTGSNGRCNDASVFNSSGLAKLLEEGALNLPEPTPLPGRTEKVPYYVVADDAFGLKTYLMKPYPFRSTTRDQKIFNKRLSTARRMVECAFGHLASRFQVFGSPIRLYPSKAEQITVSAVLLHNFLIDRKDRKYQTRLTTANRPGAKQLKGLRTHRSCNSSTKAAQKQKG